MTCTEQVERFPLWKSFLCSDDHVDQHVVPLSLHQLCRASQCVDCKISLGHFSSRSLYLIQVYAPLDWTYPQNISSSDHFKGSIRTQDSLIQRPSGTRRIALNPVSNI